MILLCKKGIYSSSLEMLKNEDSSRESQKEERMEVIVVNRGVKWTKARGCLTRFPLKMAFS